MSTMSAHPKLTDAPNEKVHLDLTNMSVVNVTTAVTLLKFSELAALSADSAVPPKATTESTLSVPPEVPSVASTESVSFDTVETTDNASPEVTSELTEGVPQEVSSVASTESTVPLNVVEKIESAPPEVTSELTESVPPKVTTLSSASVPPGLSVESTESVHLEVTSESTESATSEVTASPTEGVVPPNVTNCATSEVTSKPTEGVVDVPPNSTTLSSVSAPRPPPPAGLTTPASTAMSVPPDQLTVARNDATCLHRAFKGMGCDKTTIVNILAQRNAAQCSLIRREYKTIFSEDFDTRLSEELKFHGDLKEALLLWMDDPARRDAKLVKHGLSEMLKTKVTIEVICSRTPSQLEQLKKAYHSMFDAYLEQDIESHAFGDNKKLLLEYVGTRRSESQEVNKKMVDEDAKALFKDGEYKLGTNEETFIHIFSKRSWAHLAAVNSAYRIMYMNSLKKAVKKETSWNFKSALLIIIQCAENPSRYFAKALRKAMKGFGTDEEALSRIIVSRAEVDIQQIKAEYFNKYGKKLSDVVHSETSGHYRSFLLALLNQNH